jgi:glycine oxidase
MATRRSADVLIVGGGAIGLSIAWRLAQRGASVTVIDRGAMTGEASSQATGVIQPLTDPEAPRPYLDLCLASNQRFPAFAREVLDATGLDVEYGETGVLRVGVDEAEAASLERHAAWLESLRFPVERLDGRSLREREAALSARLSFALLEPTSRWLNAPVFAQALARAAAGAGVALLPECGLAGVEWEGGRIVAVRAGTERLPASRFVIAAGTWSGEVAARFGLSAPVVPVRGQLLSLAGEPGAIRHTLYGQRAHLVPWRSGEVIVASTLEYVGFNKAVTAGGIGGLLAGTMEQVPRAGAWPIRRMWACLRPGTPDRLPILGRAPGLGNVFIATGHFRKGILLTPITADLMADVIMDKAPPFDLHPFRSDRPSLVAPPAD